LANQQMLVRRCNIHNAPFYRLAIFRLFDPDGGPSPQQLRQQAFVARIQMLHDQDAAGKVAGQRPKHLSQCMQSTR
jgi:hypothetical protein